jgi:hypothetical protein
MTTKISEHILPVVTNHDELLEAIAELHERGFGRYRIEGAKAGKPFIAIRHVLCQGFKDGRLDSPVKSAWEDMFPLEVEGVE